ncbi:hypothetical protein CKA32_005240 [Geitlerinema sp. FC II]|nr:hypothetical protein CKA32_005240 [Geitlerinema sp. FC II]
MSQLDRHQDLVGFIWNIANKLRGPYQDPSQCSAHSRGLGGW